MIRALSWVSAGFALGVSAAALLPVQEVWDEFARPHEAQFFVVTATPIRNLVVTYDGKRIEQRPGWPTRDVVGYAAFPGMRASVLEPVLSVSWEGPNGPQSISRAMRQFDSGRLCLYVLNLDGSASPIELERPDNFSPFWWTCSSY
ncbi:hypothetical protein J4558_26895 [Leptolyngbya sp. 15MV]|nr:hypothetical protein J4558_26895 [Leptolyngbya sp. 15MV]